MEMVSTSKKKRRRSFEPLLIIVSGPPASGKTFIGKKLAREFNLPFLNKDSIKEILFDQLGWSDIEWSRKLNSISLELLYKFAKVQLTAGCPLILESNFKPEIDTPKFLALKDQYQCRFVQIQCIAQGEVLVGRFKNRAASGIRHPGHVDSELESYLEPLLLSGRQGNLEIGDDLIEVDTTDFNKIDYVGLSEFISNKLKSNRGV